MAQRWLLSALALALMAVGGIARAEDAGSGPADNGLLTGRVRSTSEPLSAAAVYAYQLADLSLQKVLTDREGNFLFKRLPAGLYKIIAHKTGFVPAVVTLARNSGAVDQVVDLELLADEATTLGRGDFWSVRKRIPVDVLRDLGLESAEDRPQLAERSLSSFGAGDFANPLDRIQAQMRVQALAGVREGVEKQVSQMSGGRVELDGVLGETRIDFDGYFLEMQDAAGSAEGAGLTGRQSALSLALSGGGNSKLSLATNTSRLSAAAGGQGSPVDFEQFLLSFTKPVGSRGESELLAQYTAENNFYGGGWIDPGDVPDASRTLNIQGSYSREIGSQGQFATELRYRERERSFLPPAFAAASLQPVDRYAEELVELTGRGGWKLQPAVLVEYGLTTRLRDGSLSFVPHGGLVVQLGEFWQAIAQFSEHVRSDDRGPYDDFVPAFFHEAGQCRQGEEHCYRVALARQGQGDDRLTFSAAHREFGETMRLFFSEDFFDHLEGLFLVRGDRLPEMQMAFTHRLSPQILTTVESSVAAGGGGIVYSLDGEPYENRVRYLVTSLDTQFESTSTGVLLAFHSLQQQLGASPSSASGASGPAMELDRLQLRVTQDLSFLLDLAADWAVHLNMELSRGNPLGTEAFSAADGAELRKRFLGGVAVRF